MPGAWEIMKRNSVLVGVLHVDTTTVAWSLGLRSLIIPGPEPMCLAGMPFDHARNMASMRLLESGLDYLFFLDSDVVAPRDTILRLMSYRQPIVSGVYHRRSPPASIPVMLKNGAWYDAKPNTGVHEVDLVGAGCLLPDTEVLTNFAPLKAKKVGNHRALTGKGRYRRIVASKSRVYSGDVVGLSSTSFTPSVWLTPEHPVFVIPKEWVEWCKPDSPLAPSLIEQFGKFVEAGNIEDGDYVATPIYKDVVDVTSILLSDYVFGDEIISGGGEIYYKTGRNPSTGQLVKYRNRIVVDNDFLEFCGFYLAEGSAGKELVIHLGAHEKALIERVVELVAHCFGRVATLKTKDGSTSVRVGGKILARFFRENFGRSSETKKIPQWMMALPVTKQFSLMKSLVQGDGHVVRGRGRCKSSQWVSYATVSKTLARQVQQLFLRGGMVCTVRKTAPQKSNRGNISPTEKRQRRLIEGRFPVWVVNLYARNAWWFTKHILGEELDLWGFGRWQRSFIVDGILYSRAKVKRSTYEGNVFDFQVEGDHTYVAGNFLVHNCLLIHRDVIQNLPPQRPGKHWFDWRVDMAGVLPHHECLSEDFTFCFHARQHGYRILADTSIQCKHIGLAQATYGKFEPLDLAPAA